MQINSVKVIQDSINYSGNRMITYEIETYRYIWAEVLTHKMLNKNAQSSRAVPVKSVLSINEDSPVEPIVWGKNQGGMSASTVLENEELEYVKQIWKDLAKTVFEGSRKLSEAGLHKMWANRPTEPFSRIKVVMSGTEWDNFEWLRDDPEAAQPEIVDLARKIKQAKSESVPMLLASNWAHVPYVDRVEEQGIISYYVQGEGEVSLDIALKISASCCGQVSYRKLDDSFEKAMDIYHKLFNGAKPHLSPTEHQAIAMQRTKANVLDRLFPSTWEKGVSHMDASGCFWSANLKGFIQHRKIMENNL
jgi:hypothetical protein